MAGRTPLSSVDPGDRCLFIRSLVTLPRAPSKIVMNRSGMFRWFSGYQDSPLTSTYIHSMQLSWPLLKKSQVWTWRPLGPLLPLTLLMETPLGLCGFHSFFAWLLWLLPFGAALTKFSNELTHSKHQASKVNCWITRQSLQRTSVCVCVMEECGRPFVFLPSITVSILFFYLQQSPFCAP